jgi:hypothetical protein
MLTLTHEGTTYESWASPDLAAAGVPAAAIGAAVKADALARSAALHEALRAGLAPASAGKQWAWTIKARCAADWDGAPAPLRAQIEGEAAALGVAVADLLAGWRAKLAALEVLALTVERLEAEAAAAIRAIPDDAEDVADRVEAALEAARAAVVAVRAGSAEA